MLPVQHRLRTGEQFSAVTRGPGRARVGSALIVVHANHTDSRAVRPPRVGFVVSKAVGGAVTRNLVKRRLRARTRELISGVPSGVDLVIRAQPASAAASWDELARECDRLVDHAVRRLHVREP